MRRRIVGVELACLAFLLLSLRPVVAGEVVTPLQMQETSPSGDLIATNWKEGTSGITSPFVFEQFDPKLGTLSSIELVLTTAIRNDYVLTFVPTPIITTLYVATSQTSDPSILADPTKRAALTDGPTVTVVGPNGTTQIFGAPATRQPVDFVELTKTSGTWSSLPLPTNPIDPSTGLPLNYIPPTNTSQTIPLNLTAANAPSLFSDFIGTGNIDLPVSATAFSSFYSSSGNGGGAVLTSAWARLTVQYVYVSSVPEPSSAILLALGIGGGFVLIHRRRHRLS
jgi:PEP-CTERM motif